VVSLDALTPALHDRHRGPGTQAAALEAIAISAARGRRVYINMVVHRDTLAEIEPMLAFCEARGFRLNAQAVMFGHAYQDGAAEGLRLPEEEERAMYRRLADWKRAGRPLMFAASSYERTARWADYRVHVAAAAGPSPCMAGRDYLNIDPDGDVHPCGLHAGTFVPMNIRRDGFEAALRHARRHDCRDCSLAYLNERKALFGLRPSALIEFLRRA